MARLFICHAREEKKYAAAVRQWLTKKDGWRDNDIYVANVPSGEDWNQTLTNEAAAAKAMLFLASEKSLNSPYCYHELRCVRGEIITATIGGVTRENLQLKSVLPPLAISLQIIEALDGQPTQPFSFVFEKQNVSVELNATALESIGRSLRNLGVASDSYTWIPTNDGPYPGPRSLEEGEEALLFGRNIEIRDCVRELENLLKPENGRRRALMIQAPSGTGKSSLLRAGLWRRLRSHPDFTPLGIVRVRNGVVRNDAWGLISALRITAQKLNLEITREEISAGIGNDLPGLLARIADRDGEDGRRRTLLLGIDQAEEITTLSQSPQDEQEFTNLLSSLLGLRDLNLRFVLAVRDDSVKSTLEGLDKAGLEEERVHRWTLPRMPRVRFKEIITGPVAAAIHAGWRLDVDERLAEALAEAAGGASEIGDALPILALALQRMVKDKRREDGTITLQPHQTAAFIENAVEDAIKEACRNASASNEDLLRLIIPKLVDWDSKAGPKAEGAAKRMVASETDLFAVPRQGLERLANALVDQRLLTSSWSGGKRLYEIAHEALLRVEPLGPLIKARRNDFELAHALKNEAQEWDKNRRYPEFLELSGNRLRRAKELQTGRDFGPDLTGVVAEYISACDRKPKERRRKGPAISSKKLEEIQEKLRAARKTVDDLKSAAARLMSSDALSFSDRMTRLLNEVEQDLTGHDIDLAGAHRQVRHIREKTKTFWNDASTLNRNDDIKSAASKLWDAVKSLNYRIRKLIFTTFIFSRPSLIVASFFITILTLFVFENEMNSSFITKLLRDRGQDNTKIEIYTASGAGVYYSDFCVDKILYAFEESKGEYQKYSIINKKPAPEPECTKSAGSYENLNNILWGESNKLDGPSIQTMFSSILWPHQSMVAIVQADTFLKLGVFGKIILHSKIRRIETGRCEKLWMITFNKKYKDYTDILNNINELEFVVYNGGNGDKSGSWASLEILRDNINTLKNAKISPYGLQFADFLKRLHRDADNNKDSVGFFVQDDDPKNGNMIEIEKYPDLLTIPVWSKDISEIKFDGKPVYRWPSKFKTIVHVKDNSGKEITEPATACTPINIITDNYSWYDLFVRMTWDWPAPVHPGTVIQEHLKARGLSQKDFPEWAKSKKDIKEEDINSILNIINKEATITPKTAELLEQAFDFKAGYWMEIQDRWARFVGRIKKFRGHRDNEERHLPDAE